MFTEKIYANAKGTEVFLMKQLNIKTPLVLRVGVALLIAVTLSCHGLGGVLAKYVASAEGSDSAYVAGFEIDQSLTVRKSNGEEISDLVVGDTLIPGQSTFYTFDVVNRSEVAVRFTVSGQSLLGELPLIMETVWADISPNAVDRVTFAVTWDDTNRNVDLGGLMDIISITVTAAQID